MHQHVSGAPPPLSTRIGGLAGGLDAVLSRALAKDPAARPPTCRAFADAVAAFAPVGITPPPTLVSRDTAGPSTSPTIIETPEVRPAPAAAGTTPRGPPPPPPPLLLSGGPSAP